MSVWQAILMGFVHGITEFLPVSSSGHLIFIQQLFEITGKDKMFFNVCLHVATLVVICLAFRNDCIRLFRETIHMLQDIMQNLVIRFYNRRQLEPKRYVKIVSSNYRRIMIMLLVSCIPTAIIGFLLRGLAVEASHSLLSPAIGFFLTAVVLLVAEYTPEEYTKSPRNATCSEAAIIGVFQGLSTFPGISRAGVTLSACFLCGYSRKFAIKYCFLSAIPTIVGALIFEIRYVDFASITWKMAATCFLSMLVAMGTGVFMIRLIYKVLHKKYMKYFAAYSIAAGCLLIAAYFIT